MFDVLTCPETEENPDFWCIRTPQRIGHRDSSPMAYLAVLASSEAPNAPQLSRAKRGVAPQPVGLGEASLPSTPGVVQRARPPTMRGRLGGDAAPPCLTCLPYERLMDWGRRRPPPRRRRRRTGGLGHRRRPPGIQRGIHRRSPRPRKWSKRGSGAGGLVDSLPRWCNETRRHCAATRGAPRRAGGISASQGGIAYAAGYRGDRWRMSTSAACASATLARATGGSGIARAQSRGAAWGGPRHRAWGLPAQSRGAQTQVGGRLRWPGVAAQTRPPAWPGCRV